MGKKLRTQKLLFICSRNKWRSPTAEVVFRKRFGVETRSRGTSKHAVKHVSAHDLQWADHVFAMEHKHAQRLRAAFPKHLSKGKIVVLDIPDHYRFKDPDLISLLCERVDPHLVSRLTERI